MEVTIQKTMPAGWTRGASYETRFIYVGFSRYDTTKKVLSKFAYDNYRIIYSEMQSKSPSLSRGYYTEHATVTLFSGGWAEELAPGEVHFFVRNHLKQPVQQLAHLA